jgi:lycopene beta-cyclase
MNTERADLILVGAGLANGLLAYRLAATRPDLHVLVLESGSAPGGNHTWSFHGSDLTPAESAWLDPFIVHRWPGYAVAFPRRARRLGIGYRAATSDRFAEVLQATLGPRLRCGVSVAELAPTRVVLADGAILEAGAVVDGRGPAPSSALDLAYQKFLGLELQLARPHGLTEPILMDGTVEQADGFRFVYVLPFGPDRLLIEDTYYADGPSLDAPALRTRLDGELAARGWIVAAVLREETGVLPITLGGDIAAFWREGADGVPRTGLRAGLFHPTTGYSLPDAVRLADHVAGLPDLRAPALFSAIRAWSRARWREQRFFRLLNRMLFRAGSPSQRFRVLERFYGLPEPSIRRFYAGRLAASDKMRLLAGKPPVPILGAMRALMGGQPRER